MGAVATIQGAVTSRSEASARIACHQMPLTFLRDDESARILKVRGNEDMRHHLENLGFIPGSDIRVVSHQGGNYIVEVKGSQVAIDKSVASKIITN